MTNVPCTWLETIADTTKKSYTFPLQVADCGAWTMPPTFFTHPVASSSAGVQFQSPPSAHGPDRLARVNAIVSRRSRLHLAVIPTELLRYGVPQFMPPLPMAATLRMANRPGACSR